MLTWNYNLCMISIEKKKEGMCHVDLFMRKNVVIRKRQIMEAQMCFCLRTYYLGSITLSACRGVLALAKCSVVCGEDVGFHSFPDTNHGTTLRYIVIF